MRKLLFSIASMTLIVINVNAQKWVVAKNYKDEWGDLTGKRLIKQQVEGYLPWDQKIIIEISKDVPSTDDFIVSAYLLNGEPYELFDLGGSDKEERLIFRYKFGETESSFNIIRQEKIFFSSGPLRMNFKVNYSKLNAILLSTSSPIKCLIAKETNYPGEVKTSNIYRFTIYPANYIQLAY